MSDIRDELRRRGWTTIARGKGDADGKFSGILKIPPEMAGWHKIIAVVRDKEGHIVQTSNVVEIFVQKPSGRCPKCHYPTVSTGETRRIRKKLTASLSHRPLGMEWTFEKEHQCTKCRRKFPQSLIDPFK